MGLYEEFIRELVILVMKKNELLDELIIFVIETIDQESDDMISEEFKNICRTKVENWKPCPFCGGHVTLVINDEDEKTTFDVACYTEGCYLQTGADWYLPLDTLEKKWNNRPADNKHNLTTNTT
jgi:hypothetical protein